MGICSPKLLESNIISILSVVHDFWSPDSEMMNNGLAYKTRQRKKNSFS